MKKLLLIFCLVCFPIAILAQDTVLGINFGNSYSSVKTSLENRYGTLNVMEDKGTLRVFDISVGDYTFNMGEFDFQYSGSDSYFYENRGMGYSHSDYISCHWELRWYE